MSINWHDLIQFHHSPFEVHKKLNVWAVNGMGPPLRASNHMDYFIQNKSFSAQTVSWEDVKNVETNTTLVKLYTQLCFSLITVKFRSGHCTRSSDLCCSNFPIMQLVVFWFIFFSQGQSWMLPFILAVDTSWFRCQVWELLVSTGRAATSRPAEKLREIQGLTD